MKDYVEKILLYIVPLFLMISICYNNGYWSLYPINIYDYYQVSDILKAIALPSFNFLSVAFLPLVIVAAVIFSFNKTSKNVIKDITELETDGIKPNNTFESLDQITPIWARLLVKFFLFVIVPCGIIYIVEIFGFLLSPYLQDSIFTDMYFESMPNSLQLSMVLIIIVPILGAFLLKIISILTNRVLPIFKFTLMFFLTSSR